MRKKKHMIAHDLFSGTRRMGYRGLDCLDFEEREEGMDGKEYPKEERKTNDWKEK